MKRVTSVLFILILFLSLSTFAANSKNEVDFKMFWHLTFNNSGSMKIAALNYELAKMQYEESKVVQETQKDQLLSKKQFLQAEDSYNASVKAFFSQMMSLYNNLATVQEQIKNKESMVKIKKLNLNSKKKALSIGNATQNEVDQAEIDLSNAESSLLSLKENIEKWKREYLFNTSEISTPATFLPISFKELAIPDYSATLFSLYISKDVQLEIKQIDSQISHINAELAKTTSSTQDIDIAEKNAELADLTLKKYQFDEEETFISMYNSLREAVDSLKNAEKSLVIARSDFEDTKTKYAKGLISESNYLAQLSALYTQELNLETQRINTYTSYVNFKLSIGEGLEDVLNEILK